MLTRRACVSMLTCAAPAFVNCGTNVGSKSTSLTVGCMTIAECAQLFVGIAQKFFERERLEVTPNPMRGGAEILPRIQNGSLHFGFSNVVSLARLIEAEKAGSPRALVSVAGATYESPNHMNHALLVRSDSSIRNRNDLRRPNIRYAINTLRNIEELMLRRFLKETGVSMDSLHLQTMPFNEMLTALDRSAVDVVAVVEPYIVPALTRDSQYRELAVVDHLKSSFFGLSPEAGNIICA